MLGVAMPSGIATPTFIIETKDPCRVYICISVDLEHPVSYAYMRLDIFG